MKKMSTGPLTSVEMFEHWLKANLPGHLTGGKMNVLMNATWANWWPYAPRDFGAHYPTKNLYKISKRGIYIIQELP